MISKETRKILEKAGVKYSDIWMFETMINELLKDAEVCRLDDAITEFGGSNKLYRALREYLDRGKRRGLISIEEWDYAGSELYRALETAERSLKKALRKCGCRVKT